MVDQSPELIRSMGQGHNFAQSNRFFQESSWKMDEFHLL